MANPRLRPVLATAPSPSAIGLSVAERAEALVAGLPNPFAVNVFDRTDPFFVQVFVDDASNILDTSSLPLPMQHELSWWVATCHGSGHLRLVTERWCSWVRVAARVTAEASRPRRGHGRAGGEPVVSFSQLSLEEWTAAWTAHFYSLHGRMPSPHTKRNMEIALGHLLAAVTISYSPLDWWRHDVWDPTVDDRIPIREHEPLAGNPIRFSGFTRTWLREAAKFYFHVQLDTGRFAWSTAHSHRNFLGLQLDQYLVARGIDHPVLCTDPPSDLRSLALDLVSFLRQWRSRSRKASARPTLSPQVMLHAQQAIARFYAFMVDFKVEAAKALGDDRWLELTDAHARLWRPEEAVCRARSIPNADDESYIADADLSRMLSCIELLGAPRGETRSVTVGREVIEVAGLGDPSAMRAWILQALTGRRANEILMLDFEPLSEIPGLDFATATDDIMVAKLHYRQTKIGGAPDTILVGTDVVQVVREQQAWAREYFGLGEDERIKYLFPRLRSNGRRDRAFTIGSYQSRLAEIDRMVALRDAHGRPLRFSSTHRLRHTKATTLLNLGAPIHVVQRYLGHLSPEMTMRYGATLASTAEREFLALAKVGRDGRELAMDRRDLLDLMGLDRRTDRILPNGYCLLPPTKSCEKGNACHTCDHFATDRSYLPEIRRQLAETEALVSAREGQYLARHGEEMGETNVWLSQRLVEIDAMRREIAALEGQPEGGSSAVRGVGVLGRSGYQAVPVRVAPPGPGPAEKR